MSFYGLKSQKVVEKLFPLFETTSFQINAENCYKLRVSTHSLQEVLVKASMEGEYQNDIIITSKHEGATFFLETAFHKLFNNPNDKLSAHKIVSVFLDIVLPKGTSVKLLGGTTSINISGEYDKMEVVNMDENIILDSVKGNISVKSFSGNVFLNAELGNVEANSKFGTVYSKTILKGGSNFVLNTVNGNIYINKE